MTRPDVDGNGEAPGYAIPIDPLTALVIIPVPERVALEYNGTEWMTPIQHLWLPAEEGHALALATARWATREVIGSSAASVDAVATEIGRSGAPAALTGSRSRDYDGMCHLYDWFRVRSAIEQPPDRAQTAADPPWV